MPKARLAKITRPRLHGILPRERLFRLLDDKSRFPVVWLSAAPGAGKTTLVASYLQARNRPSIWYQLDSGDSDAATFFYYLKQAAPGKRPPLPLLTPEYLPNLSGFTRRYFRALFARMREGTVLVLDNYQEVSETTNLHAIVEEAILQIPDGLTVIAISRSDPPRQHARLVASERLTLIDWQDLRLTLEETQAIGSLRGANDRATLSHLHHQSDGWAAGLTLMLERMMRSGLLPEAIEAETKEAVFNYFAGEIFDKALEGHQQVLLTTAFLPRITADMASKISGHADARKLLEHLYRRHLFTDRRTGNDVTYQYHALFREFLLARARETLDPALLIRLVHQAAQLLEADGQSEAAVDLYLDARDWDAIARLVIREAGNLLAQGRGQTLRHWIDSLPKDYVHGTPWLLYWLGTSLIAVNQADARCNLEAAFERFQQAEDSPGQILRAAVDRSVFGAAFR